VTVIVGLFTRPDLDEKHINLCFKGIK
jgi:hypothetical protein